MSSGAAGIDAVEVGQAEETRRASISKAEIQNLTEKSVISDVASEITIGPKGQKLPTQDEMQTLRRVRGKIDFTIYTIAFIELSERFAYYGTTAVFVNFIQHPLPPGSTTGAGGTYGQPGALGMGQRASTGLTLFNSFWSYLMPMVGGYLADTYWGRYKTINYAIVIATIGHIIIVVSAIPQVIGNSSGSLAAFIIGLIFFGIGVGFFKCNIMTMAVL